MLHTLEGIYRDGKIELLEVPAAMAENTRVLITFLPAPSGPIDLAQREITPAQAADLRARLRSVAEDWDRPEMDAYDHYETVQPDAAPR